MSQAQRLLDHLQEAAILIEADPNAFEDALEAIVERASTQKNPDIVCSMLYAASESLRNR
jgi:hypothetical protein